MTVSISNRDLSGWVRRRSEKLGVSPDDVVADVLRRQRAAEEFRALSQDLSAAARDRGLTADALTDLLDGEVYD
ncbi:MAG: hypothetical protein AAF791_05020 [Bacteroidota bacterium]